jgi:hypothetical protein
MAATVASVRVQGDAVPAVKAVLVALFGAAVEVRDELDAGWNVLVPGTKPVIVVDDDGGPVTWPIWSRPIIRITCYANGKQTARLLRRKAMGGLMSNPPAGIYLPTQSPAAPGIGYTEARDQTTGADLASFTVTATVKTETVTV